MDTISIRTDRPEVLPSPNYEPPHGCYDGWVYLGFEVAELDENGEHVEVIERVPCRRCARRRRRDEEL